MRLLLLCLLVFPADAGRRRVEPVVAEPEPVAVELPPPSASGPLFPTILPLDPGPVPEGLAHANAQACAACHPTAYRSWVHGPHAGGPSAALASAGAGLAGCTACHRPLVAQHERLETVLDARLDQVATEANPVFDPTAWAEGVSCAACHVREGAVLTSDPAATGHQAPHRILYAPELADGRACAACHQLRLEGAAEPLYDTVGEWSRSGFEARGIGCVACHGGGAADGGAPDHDVSRPLDEGMSVLLSARSLTLVRGGPALEVVATLANTGAGHAVPTGSPWTGLRAQLFLEGPPDKKGVPRLAGTTTIDLRRTIASEPPFATLSDTRLMPGGRVDLPLALQLDDAAPTGAWQLVLQVNETVQGEVSALRVERRWPIRVE